MPPNSHDVGLRAPSTTMNPTDADQHRPAAAAAPACPAGTTRSGSGGGSSTSSPPGRAAASAPAAPPRPSPPLPAFPAIDEFVRTAPPAASGAAMLGSRPGRLGAVSEKSRCTSGGGPPGWPRADRYCRLTVLAPRGRVDVALPGRRPGRPSWCRWCWSWSASPRRAGRRGRGGCSGTAGGPLPAAATLDELGVLDGELLRLAPDVRRRPPRRSSTTRSTRWPRRSRTAGAAPAPLRRRRAGPLACGRRGRAARRGRARFGALRRCRGPAAVAAVAGGRVARPARRPVFGPRVAAAGRRCVLAAAAGWAAVPGCRRGAAACCWPPRRRRGRRRGRTAAALRVVAPALVAAVRRRRRRWPRP